MSRTTRSYPIDRFRTLKKSYLDFWGPTYYKTRHLGRDGGYPKPAKRPNIELPTGCAYDETGPFTPSGKRKAKRRTARLIRRRGDREVRDSLTDSTDKDNLPFS